MWWVIRIHVHVRTWKCALWPASQPPAVLWVQNISRRSWLAITDAKVYFRCSGYMSAVACTRLCYGMNPSNTRGLFYFGDGSRLILFNPRTRNHSRWQSGSLCCAVYSILHGAWVNVDRVHAYLSAACTCTSSYGYSSTNMAYLHVYTWALLLSLNPQNNYRRSLHLCTSPIQFRVQLSPEPISEGKRSIDASSTTSLFRPLLCIIVIRDHSPAKK